MSQPRRVHRRFGVLARGCKGFVLSQPRCQAESCSHERVKAWNADGPSPVGIEDESPWIERQARRFGARASSPLGARSRALRVSALEDLIGT